MKKIPPKDYQNMVESASPPTKSYKTIPCAFLVGGAICLLGQFIQNIYLHAGLERDLAAASTSVTLVFLSALLTGLQIYDKIAKFAGAGTLVPITGFANAVVSPALEFKSEGLILGLGAKLFTIAGPVIVYGSATAFVYGLILYLFRLY
ncbi:MAG: stage V sporulation protein AC [Provencibacterium sp.]|jgi:stage V sporulation protein AC|nr:stage V sporulation protein AC [Provencibacterium sp.]